VNELGRGSRSGPLVPPNPSRPPPNPLSLVQPPLSHLHLPQTLAATTSQTLAAPIPPLLGAALPFDLRRVGANLQLEFGGRKEERGRIQGDFGDYLLFICAAIQLIRCLCMRIGRGAVQKFCGWANSSSSSSFWEYFVGN
jgi:hypothetical protein